MHKIFLLWLFLLMSMLCDAQPPEQNRKPIKKSKVTKNDAKSKNKQKKRKKSKKDLEKEEELLSRNKKAPVYKAAPSLMYRPIVRNGKKLTGSISTRQGFRICIYDGNNRQDAFLVKQKFIQKNPKVQSYIAYNRPNYKIKVGDYDNKKIAQREHKKLLEQYPHSFITPDIVTIKNFEVQRNSRQNLQKKVSLKDKRKRSEE